MKKLISNILFLDWEILNFTKYGKLDSYISLRNIIIKLLGIFSVSFLHAII